MANDADTQEIPDLARRMQEELFRDVEIKSHSSERPLLAHYTSLGAFEKIVFSSELWMSHPLLMNDRDELRSVIDAGRGILSRSERLRQACKNNKAFTDLVDSFNLARNHYTQFLEKLTFMICFSVHDLADNDGKLGMWRGYGGNGSGIALVLDTKKIESAANVNSPFYLNPLVYLSNDQRIDRIQSAVEKIATLFENRDLSETDLKWAAVVFLEWLKMFSLFTKHNGFAEEREWRLVYLGDRDLRGVYHDLFTYLIGPRGPQPKMRIPLTQHSAIGGQDLRLETLVVLPGFAWDSCSAGRGQR